eukprot:TRINITY_DN18521_c0_g1_i1.p1 TRINITY_DN18521_c0_g1~~TRINITY_DN18521_c0_g1_i1.p1  ORF type:complete len:336 (+),score=67.93 TRINITY_DN18521_c0_g1_i1:90-1010(+)
MALRNVALAFGAAAYSAKAVYCPMNHCLKRIDKGNTSAAFSCEQYKDEGYQCAFENDPRGCTCDGYVKYGNFAQKGKNATWSTEKEVTGSIGCNNSAMGGDPISGAKVCWCRPKKPIATTRKTAAASDTQKMYYELPECIIADISTSVLGMDAATLFGVGANQAAVNILLEIGIKGIFSSPMVQWLAYDIDTMLSTVRIDCSAKGSCFGSVAAAQKKMLEERKSLGAQFATATQKFVKANEEAFGALAAIAPSVVIAFKPESFDTPSPTPAPTPAPTTEEETNAALKSHTPLFVFGLLSLAYGVLN